MSDETVFVLASGNAGKLRELQGILKPLPVQLVSQSQFQVPDVEETGLTFVENALIKARAACVHTGLAAIADDSGLEVDYLQGAPGIHSARYSGDGDSANNALLLKNLAGVPREHRRARFQCALVFLRHAFDPTPIICQGAWEGEILDTETGSHGFGYDPLFFLPQFDCSSAELAAETKNRVSHRALASAHLLEALRAQS